jgi:hypothetical protein
LFLFHSTHRPPHTASASESMAEATTLGSVEASERERERKKDGGFLELLRNISLVINIHFLFCRTNSVRDLIFV